MPRDDNSVFVNHLSCSPRLELEQTLTTCQSAAPTCELVTVTNWLSVKKTKKKTFLKWKTEIRTA